MAEGKDLRLKNLSKCQKTIDECIEKLKGVETENVSLVRDIIWTLNEIRDELKATITYIKIWRK